MGLGALTAKGAVRNPLVYLTVTLSTAAFGIVFADMETLVGVFLTGAVSLAFCMVAVSSLYCTIARIEKAALRTGHTIDFEICYKSKKTTHEIKLGIQNEITIGIMPEEDVQNFEASIYIPPQIETKSAPSGRITLQPDGFQYSGYSLVLFEKEYLSSTHYLGLTVFVVANQAGDYVLPIKVGGKGLLYHSSELVLKVTQ